MKKATPYCSAFIRSVLETRLENFIKYMPETDTPPSPEHVHRLRVAGRRLRCGLAAGAEALPGKTVRALDKALRRLVKKSGRLRDIDVKTHILQETISRKTAPKQQPGLRRLLLRLNQQRPAALRRMHKALERFRIEHVIKQLQSAIATLAEPAENPQPLELQELRHQSFTILMNRLDVFLTRAVKARNAPTPNNLHQLRIVVKKLRYSMELFAPLYQDQQQKAEETLHHLQRLLGHIHDCDVWLDYLAGFPAREKKRMLRYMGHCRQLSRLMPGIHGMARHLRRERRQTMQQLEDCWLKFDRERTWENARAAILQPPDQSVSILPDANLNHAPPD